MDKKPREKPAQPKRPEKGKPDWADSINWDAVNKPHLSDRLWRERDDK